MHSHETSALMSALRSKTKFVSEVSKRDLVSLVQRAIDSPMSGMTRDDSPKAFENELGRVLSVYLDGNMESPDDISAAIGTGASFETFLVFTHILHAYVGMTSSASAIVDGNAGPISCVVQQFAECTERLRSGDMSTADTVPIPLNLAVESLSLLTELAKLGQTMPR